MDTHVRQPFVRDGGATWPSISIPSVTIWISETCSAHTTVSNGLSVEWCTVVCGLHVIQEWTPSLDPAVIPSIDDLMAKCPSIQPPAEMVTHRKHWECEHVASWVFTLTATGSGA